MHKPSLDTDGFCRDSKHSCALRNHTYATSPPTTVFPLTTGAVHRLCLIGHTSCTRAARLWHTMSCKADRWMTNSGCVERILRHAAAGFQQRQPWDAQQDTLRSSLNRGPDA